MKSYEEIKEKIKELGKPAGLRIITKSFGKDDTNAALFTHCEGANSVIYINKDCILDETSLIVILTHEYGHFVDMQVGGHGSEANSFIYDDEPIPVQRVATEIECEAAAYRYGADFLEEYFPEVYEEIEQDISHAMIDYIVSSSISMIIEIQKRNNK